MDLRAAAHICFFPVLHTSSAARPAYRPQPAAGLGLWENAPCQPTHTPLPLRFAATPATHAIDAGRARQSALGEKDVGVRGREKARKGWHIRKKARAEPHGSHIAPKATCTDGTGCASALAAEVSARSLSWSVWCKVPSSIPALAHRRKSNVAARFISCRCACVDGQG